MVALCIITLFSTDIDDLYDVYSELIPVAGRWKRLGLALRLHPDTIDRIEKDKDNVEDRLYSVLTQWLKKAYNVQRFGQPSWQLLVKAVRDPAGGDNQALADTVAAKYGGKGSLFTSRGFTVTGLCMSSVGQ